MSNYSSDSDDQIVYTRRWFGHEKPLHAILGEGTRDFLTFSHPNLYRFCLLWLYTCHCNKYQPNTFFKMTRRFLKFKIASKLFCSCWHSVMEEQELISFDTNRIHCNMVSVRGCGVQLCDFFLPCLNSCDVSCVRLVYWGRTSSQVQIAIRKLMWFITCFFLRHFNKHLVFPMLITRNPPDLRALTIPESTFRWLLTKIHRFLVKFYDVSSGKDLKTFFLVQNSFISFNLWLFSGTSFINSRLLFRV